MMRFVRTLPLCGLACTLLSPAIAMAQAVAPTVRILSRIDNSNMVTLRGNTHPLANAKNDRGLVSPALPMTGLILVLSRDSAQQAAFDSFVASQYDPHSPNFHHWLTPQQVGADFGPAETDIATVSNWLTGSGFSIAQVTPDRMTIRFSGTAAQVQSAFHTEIHNLEVKGVAHIGNMSDPQIPAALAPVVVGVKSLHNFFPRPLHRMGSRVTKDSATGKWKRIPASTAASAANPAAAALSARPQFGISVPATGSTSAYLVEDVAPYDFATIYNVLPLWNAGTPIDGTGETIAIAGTSDIDVGQTSETGANGTNDIYNFRNTFGLPTGNSYNTPIRITGNSEPLTVCTSTTVGAQCGIDDLIENTLDVEWAGSVAKNAQIELVASYPSSDSDDNLYDSESTIVNTSPLIAGIMNVSYGVCELDNGTAGNVLYYDLWQQAASEGIAVFVASGDGGSANCDSNGDSAGNPYSAQHGLAVSGLSSTPFNTSVGGTDFNWCQLPSATQTTECTASPYWSSTNDGTTGATALGYVPEVPWNETCANPLTLPFLEKWANSSDANSVGGVTDTESACNFIYNNWQTVYSNTSDELNLSYLVDSIGGSGGASGCVVNTTAGATLGSCTTSSTTTGADNGSLTLVNDGWPKPSWQAGVPGIPDDSVRDLPDVSFFASDGVVSSSSYLVCVSQVADCSFTAGSEPFAEEVGGTSVASPAMAGVMALIDQKVGSVQGLPNAELYSLAAKQTYSSCSAESVTAGSTSCYFNDIDTQTNAMPCDYGATEGDPATSGIQSPDCAVIHSGDLIGILPSYSAGIGYDQATGLGSLNVANLVNAWSTTVPTGTATVTVSPASTTLDVSTALSVPVTVASSPSGGTTPTGTMTLYGGGYTSATETVSSGAYTFNIPANSLSTGSDVLTVAYSGDSNYLPAYGTASITVTGATVSTGTFTLSASAPSSITAGSSTTSTVTVSTANGYYGAVTLSCALTTSPSGAADLPTCSGGSSTVTLSSDTTSGTATVSVSTTAAATSQLVKPGRGGGWASGGAILAFLVFLGIPSRRRAWRSILGIVAGIAILGSLTGCGDFWQAPSSSSSSGTTAGTYTFTVTGTGDPTVTPAATTTFTVTVSAAS